MDNEITVNDFTPQQPQPGTSSLTPAFSSPITDMVVEVAPSLQGLSSYKERREKISKGNQQVVVQEDPLKIWKKNKDAYTVGVTFREPKGMKNYIKVYVHILKEATKQCFQDGRMVTNSIQLSLDGFIEDNLCNSKPDARRKYNGSKKVLKGVDIAFILPPKKKGEKALEYEGPVFARYSNIVNSEMEIKLNPEFPWEIVMEYYKSYMYLPIKRMNLLTTNSYVLAYYIFYLARQNGESIKKNGGFRISNRAIQARLGLPDEGKIKNPKRDIREVIENCCQEITQIFKHDNAFLFTIKQCDTDTVSIKKYLDNGYLWVTIGGELKQLIMQQNAKQEKIIDKLNKRKERVVDQAKVKALADKIKAEGGGKDAEN